MDRLYYEKYTSWDDYGYYSTLVSNHEIMNMNYGRIFTPQETKLTFEGLLKHSTDHHSRCYKVFLKDVKTYIGYCSLIYNSESAQGEISYMLLPEYWNKGYATEMVHYLQVSAKKHPDIKKLTAITDPANLGSQKILLNNGFSSCKKYQIDDGSWTEVFEKKLERVSY